MFETGVPLILGHGVLQLMSEKKKNSVIVSKVSLSLSLEADCARDRTQGLFHRLLAITLCCTDSVQLTLQNLGGQFKMLCRLQQLTTCIPQQCRRRRRGRILLQ